MKKLFSSLIALVVAVLATLGEKLYAACEGYMWNSGLRLGVMPTMGTVNQLRATDPNTTETIRQRLYDHLLYPAAGITQMSFFSTPIGQGQTSSPSGTVGAAKTLADTNMQAANTLPSGKAYIMESIEVYFYPGTVSTANTFTPAWIVTATAAAAANITQIRDVQQFYESGVLQFNILDKNQLTETPLRSFPPKTWFDASVALSTAVGGTTLEISALHGYPNGRPYILEPKVSISPTETFAVNLIWEKLYPTDSTFNARVGVYFDGYLLRATQ